MASLRVTGTTGPLPAAAAKSRSAVGGVAVPLARATEGRTTPGNVTGDLPRAVEGRNCPRRTPEGLASATEYATASAGVPEPLSRAIEGRAASGRFADPRSRAIEGRAASGRFAERLSRAIEGRNAAGGIAEALAAAGTLVTRPLPGMPRGTAPRAAERGGAIRPLVASHAWPVAGTGAVTRTGPVTGCRVRSGRCRTGRSGRVKPDKAVRAIALGPVVRKAIRPGVALVVWCALSPLVVASTSTPHVRPALGVSFPACTIVRHLAATVAQLGYTSVT